MCVMNYIAQATGQHTSIIEHIHKYVLCINGGVIVLIMDPMFDVTVSGMFVIYCLRRNICKTAM